MFFEDSKLSCIANNASQNNMGDMKMPEYGVFTVILYGPRVCTAPEGDVSQRCRPTAASPIWIPQYALGQLEWHCLGN